MKAVTINIPDHHYDAIQAAADDAGRTIEEYCFDRVMDKASELLNAAPQHEELLE